MSVLWTPSGIDLTEMGDLTYLLYRLVVMWRPCSQTRAFVVLLIVALVSFLNCSNTQASSANLLNNESPDYEVRWTKNPVPGSERVKRDEGSIQAPSKVDKHDGSNKLKGRRKPPPPPALPVNKGNQTAIPTSTDKGKIETTTVKPQLAPANEVISVPQHLNQNVWNQQVISEDANAIPEKPAIPQTKRNQTKVQEPNTMERIVDSKKNKSSEQSSLSGSSEDSGSSEFVSSYVSGEDYVITSSDDMVEMYTMTPRPHDWQEWVIKMSEMPPTGSEEKTYYDLEENWRNQNGHEEVYSATMPTSDSGSEEKFGKPWREIVYELVKDRYRGGKNREFDIVHPDSFASGEALEDRKPVSKNRTQSFVKLRTLIRPKWKVRQQIDFKVDFFKKKLEGDREVQKMVQDFSEEDLELLWIFVYQTKQSNFVKFEKFYKTLFKKKNPQWKKIVYGIVKSRWAGTDPKTSNVIVVPVKSFSSEEREEIDFKETSEKEKEREKFLSDIRRKLRIKWKLANQKKFDVKFFLKKLDFDNEARDLLRPMSDEEHEMLWVWIYQNVVDDFPKFEKFYKRILKVRKVGWRRVIYQMVQERHNEIGDPNIQVVDIENFSSEEEEDADVERIRKKADMKRVDKFIKLRMILREWWNVRQNPHIEVGKFREKLKNDEYLRKETITWSEDDLEVLWIWITQDVISDFIKFEHFYFKILKRKKVGWRKDIYRLAKDLYNGSSTIKVVDPETFDSYESFIADDDHARTHRFTKTKILLRERFGDVSINKTVFEMAEDMEKDSEIQDILQDWSNKDKQTLWIWTYQNVIDDFPKFENFLDEIRRTKNPEWKKIVYELAKERFDPDNETYFQVVQPKTFESEEDKYREEMPEEQKNLFSSARSRIRNALNIEDGDELNVEQYKKKIMKDRELRNLITELPEDDLDKILIFTHQNANDDYGTFEPFYKEIVRLRDAKPGWRYKIYEIVVRRGKKVKRTNMTIRNLNSIPSSDELDEALDEPEVEDPDRAEKLTKFRIKIRKEGGTDDEGADSKVQKCKEKLKLDKKYKEYKNLNDTELEKLCVWVNQDYTTNPKKFEKFYDKLFKKIGEPETTTSHSLTRRPPHERIDSDEVEPELTTTKATTTTRRSTKPPTTTKKTTEIPEGRRLQEDKVEQPSTPERTTLSSTTPQRGRPKADEKEPEGPSTTLKPSTAETTPRTSKPSTTTKRPKLKQDKTEPKLISSSSTPKGRMLETDSEETEESTTLLEFVTSEPATARQPIVETENSSPKETSPRSKTSSVPNIEELKTSTSIPEPETTETDRSEEAVESHEQYNQPFSNASSTPSPTEEPAREKVTTVKQGNGDTSDHKATDESYEHPDRDFENIDETIENSDEAETTVSPSKLSDNVGTVETTLKTDSAKKPDGTTLTESPDMNVSTEIPTVSTSTNVNDSSESTPDDNPGKTTAHPDTSTVSEKTEPPEPESAKKGLQKGKGLMAESDESEERPSVEGRTTTPKAGGEEGHKPSHSGDKELLPLCPAAEEGETDMPNVVANALSQTGKVQANALSKLGNASATAVNGTEANALAASDGRNGNALATSDSFGEGGAKAAALTSGAGNATSSGMSRGTGNAGANSIARNGGSSQAESVAMNGGNSTSNAISTCRGHATGKSLAVNGSSQANAITKGSGDAKAISEAGADNGTSRAMAESKGGNATANSDTRGHGDSTALASTIGNGSALANSISKSGEARADADAEDGDSHAFAGNGDIDASFEHPARDFEFDETVLHVTPFNPPDSDSEEINAGGRNSQKKPDGRILEGEADTVESDVSTSTVTPTAATPLKNIKSEGTGEGESSDVTTQGSPSSKESSTDEESGKKNGKRPDGRTLDGSPDSDQNGQDTDSSESTTTTPATMAIATPVSTTPRGTESPDGNQGNLKSTKGTQSGEDSSELITHATPKISNLHNEPAHGPESSKPPPVTEKRIDTSDSTTSKQLTSTDLLDESDSVKKNRKRPDGRTLDGDASSEDTTEQRPATSEENNSRNDGKRPDGITLDDSPDSYHGSSEPTTESPRTVMEASSQTSKKQGNRPDGITLSDSPDSHLNGEGIDSSESTTTKNAIAGMALSEEDEDTSKKNRKGPDGRTLDGLTDIDKEGTKSVPNEATTTTRHDDMEGEPSTEYSAGETTPIPATEAMPLNMNGSKPNESSEEKIRESSTNYPEETPNKQTEVKGTEEPRIESDKQRIRQDTSTSGDRSGDSTELITQGTPKSSEKSSKKPSGRVKGVGDTVTDKSKHLDEFSSLEGDWELVTHPKETFSDEDVEIITAEPRLLSPDKDHQIPEDSLQKSGKGGTPAHEGSRKDNKKKPIPTTPEGSTPSSLTSEGRKPNIEELDEPSTPKGSHPDDSISPRVPEGRGLKEGKEEPDDSSSEVGTYTHTLHPESPDVDNTYKTTHSPSDYGGSGPEDALGSSEGTGGDSGVGIFTLSPESESSDELLKATTSNSVTTRVSKRPKLTIKTDQGQTERSSTSENPLKAEETSMGSTTLKISEERGHTKDNGNENPATSLAPIDSSASSKLIPKTPKGRRLNEAESSTEMQFSSTDKSAKDTPSDAISPRIPEAKDEVASTPDDSSLEVGSYSHTLYPEHPDVTYKTTHSPSDYGGSGPEDALGSSEGGDSGAAMYTLTPELEPETLKTQSKNPATGEDKVSEFTLSPEPDSSEQTEGSNKQSKNPATGRDEVSGFTLSPEPDSSEQSEGSKKQSKNPATGGDEVSGFTLSPEPDSSEQTEGSKKQSKNPATDGDEVSGFTLSPEPNSSEQTEGSNKQSKKPAGKDKVSGFTMPPDSAEKDEPSEQTIKKSPSKAVTATATEKSDTEKLDETGDLDENDWHTSTGVVSTPRPLETSTLNRIDYQDVATDLTGTSVGYYTTASSTHSEETEPSNPGGPKTGSQKGRGLQADVEESEEAPEKEETPIEGLTTTPKGRAKEERKPSKSGNGENAPLCPAAEEGETDKPNAVANALSQTGIAQANALSKLGNASATAVNGSKADALAVTGGRNGQAQATADSYGEGGAKAAALTSGAGNATSSGMSRGTGNAGANSIARNGGSSQAESVAMNGGNSSSNAISTCRGHATGESTAVNGSSQANAITKGSGNAKAISEAGADNGTSRAMAESKGGNATANSDTLGKGGSTALASTKGNGSSNANSISKSGEARADANAEDGDSHAFAGNGDGDASFENPEKDFSNLDDGTNSDERERTTSAPKHNTGTKKAETPDKKRKRPDGRTLEGDADMDKSDVSTSTVTPALATPRSEVTTQSSTASSKEPSTDEESSKKKKHGPDGRTLNGSPDTDQNGEDTDSSEFTTTRRASKMSDSPDDETTQKTSKHPDRRTHDSSTPRESLTKLKISGEEVDFVETVSEKNEKLPESNTLGYSDRTSEKTVSETTTKSYSKDKGRGLQETTTKNNGERPDGRATNGSPDSDHNGDNADSIETTPGTQPEGTEGTSQRNTGKKKGKGPDGRTLKGSHDENEEPGATTTKSVSKAEAASSEEAPTEKNGKQPDGRTLKSSSVSDRNADSVDSSESTTGTPQKGTKGTSSETPSKKKGNRPDDRTRDGSPDSDLKEPTSENNEKLPESNTLKNYDQNDENNESDEVATKSPTIDKDTTGTPRKGTKGTLSENPSKKKGNRSDGRTLEGSPDENEEPDESTTKSDTKNNGKPPDGRTRDDSTDSGINGDNIDSREKTTGTPRKGTKGTTSETPSKKKGKAPDGRTLEGSPDENEEPGATTTNSVSKAEATSSEEAPTEKNGKRPDGRTLDGSPDSKQNADNFDSSETTTGTPQKGTKGTSSEPSKKKGKEPGGRTLEGSPDENEGPGATTTKSLSKAEGASSEEASTNKNGKRPDGKTLDGSPDSDHNGENIDSNEDTTAARLKDTSSEQTTTSRSKRPKSRTPHHDDKESKEDEGSHSTTPAVNKGNPSQKDATEITTSTEKTKPTNRKRKGKGKGGNEKSPPGNSGESSGEQSAWTLGPDEEDEEPNATQWPETSKSPNDLGTGESTKKGWPTATTPSDESGASEETHKATRVPTVSSAPKKKGKETKQIPKDKNNLETTTISPYKSHSSSESPILLGKGAMASTEDEDEISTPESENEQKNHVTTTKFPSDNHSPSSIDNNRFTSTFPSQRNKNNRNRPDGKTLDGSPDSEESKEKTDSNESITKSNSKDKYASSEQATTKKNGKRPDGRTVDGSPDHDPNRKDTDSSESTTATPRSGTEISTSENTNRKKGKRPDGRTSDGSPVSDRNRVNIDSSESTTKSRPHDKEKSSEEAPTKKNGKSPDGRTRDGSPDSDQNADNVDSSETTTGTPRKGTKGSTSETPNKKKGKAPDGRTLEGSPDENEEPGATTTKSVSKAEAASSEEAPTEKNGKRPDGRPLKGSPDSKQNVDNFDSSETTTGTPQKGTKGTSSEPSKKKGKAPGGRTLEGSRDENEEPGATTTKSLSKAEGASSEEVSTNKNGKRPDGKTLEGSPDENEEPHESTTKYATKKNGKEPDDRTRDDSPDSDINIDSSETTTGTPGKDTKGTLSKNPSKKKGKGPDGRTLDGSPDDIEGPDATTTAKSAPKGEGGTSEEGPSKKKGKGPDGRTLEGSPVENEGTGEPSTTKSVRKKNGNRPDGRTLEGSPDSGENGDNIDSVETTTGKRRKDTEETSPEPSKKKGKQPDGRTLEGSPDEKEVPGESTTKSTSKDEVATSEETPTKNNGKRPDGRTLDGSPDADNNDEDSGSEEAPITTEKNPLRSPKPSSSAEKAPTADNAEDNSEEQEPEEEDQPNASSPSSTPNDDAGEVPKDDDGTSSSSKNQDNPKANEGTKGNPEGNKDEKPEDENSEETSDEEPAATTTEPELLKNKERTSPGSGGPDKNSPADTDGEGDSDNPDEEKGSENGEQAAGDEDSDEETTIQPATSEAGTTTSKSGGSIVPLSTPDSRSKGHDEDDKPDEDKKKKSKGGPKDTSPTDASSEPDMDDIFTMKPGSTTRPNKASEKKSKPVSTNRPGKENEKQSKPGPTNRPDTENAKKSNPGISNQPDKDNAKKSEPGSTIRPDKENSKKSKPGIWDSFPNDLDSMFPQNTFKKKPTTVAPTENRDETEPEPTSSSSGDEDNESTTGQPAEALSTAEPYPQSSTEPNPESSTACDCCNCICEKPKNPEKLERLRQMLNPKYKNGYLKTRRKNNVPDNIAEDDVVKMEITPKDLQEIIKLVRESGVKDVSEVITVKKDELKNVDVVFGSRELAKDKDKDIKVVFGSEELGGTATTTPKSKANVKSKPTKKRKLKTTTTAQPKSNSTTKKPKRRKASKQTTVTTTAKPKEMSASAQGTKERITKKSKSKKPKHLTTTAETVESPPAKPKPLNTNEEPKESPQEKPKRLPITEAPVESPPEKPKRVTTTEAPVESAPEKPKLEEPVEPPPPEKTKLEEPVEPPPPEKPKLEEPVEPPPPEKFVMESIKEVTDTPMRKSSKLKKTKKVTTANPIEEEEPESNIDDDNNDNTISPSKPKSLSKTTKKSKNADLVKPKKLQGKGAANRKVKKGEDEKKAKSGKQGKGGKNQKKSSKKNNVGAPTDSSEAMAGGAKSDGDHNYGLLIPGGQMQNMQMMDQGGLLGMVNGMVSAGTSAAGSVGSSAMSSASAGASAMSGASSGVMSSALGGATSVSGASGGLMSSALGGASAMGGAMGGASSGVMSSALGGATSVSGASGGLMSSALGGASAMGGASSGVMASASAGAGAMSGASSNAMSSASAGAMGLSQAGGMGMSQFGNTLGTSNMVGAGSLMGSNNMIGISNKGDASSMLNNMLASNNMIGGDNMISTSNMMSSNKMLGGSKNMFPAAGVRVNPNLGKGVPTVDGFVHKAPGGISAAGTSAKGGSSSLSSGSSSFGSSTSSFGSSLSSSASKGMSSIFGRRRRKRQVKQYVPGEPIVTSLVELIQPYFHHNGKMPRTRDRTKFASVLDILPPRQPSQSSPNGEANSNIIFVHR